MDPILVLCATLKEAAVRRQQNAFGSLPVVYGSARAPYSFIGRRFSAVFVMPTVPRDTAPGSTINTAMEILKRRLALGANFFFIEQTP